ncbi:hypothetical protein IMCC26256_111732 [Actinobacteria bacterium IMCC26256]|nr:hypothetical protein IMCC26256_111732 [Actinobacteria bacterium IMCC26256]
MSEEIPIPWSREVNPADPLTPIFSGERTLADFWSWAYSDLVSNDVRGVFGEYLVAHALNIAKNTRVSWAAYDLEYEGFYIEVKTTGDAQAWKPPKTLSTAWGIGASKGWLPESDTYETEPTRSAHAYVFCHWMGVNPAQQFAPADLDIWDFYVVATSVLNERYPWKTVKPKKTLSLSEVRTLVYDGVAEHTSFDGLKACVNKALGIKP